LIAVGKWGSSPTVKEGSRIDIRALPDGRATAPLSREWPTAIDSNAPALIKTTVSTRRLFD